MLPPRRVLRVNKAEVVFYIPGQGTMFPSTMKINQIAKLNDVALAVVVDKKPFYIVPYFVKETFQSGKKDNKISLGMGSRIRTIIYMLF